MATKAFSTLVNNQHLTFNPDVDVLYFDSALISANAVNVAQVGANLSFSYGGKTVWLDNVRLENLVLNDTTTSITFANGSGIGFGDWGASPIHDWEGIYYSLETLTDAVQVWGLGGADHVVTGSGADLLVGNVATRPAVQVSVDLGGSYNENYACSVWSSISADGNFIGFKTFQCAMIRDVSGAQTWTEHKSTTGVTGNSGGSSAYVSPDGSVAVFGSPSSNLVPGPTGGSYDLYMSDLHGPDVIRISTDVNGAMLNGWNEEPSVSYDGNYVSFTSRSSNGVGGSVNGFDDIYLKNVATGNLTLISKNQAGVEGNAASTLSQVSADGRYVVFQSNASNLVTGDNNGKTDIFVWDGTTQQLINLTNSLTELSNPLYTSGAYNPDVASSTLGGGVVVFDTPKRLLSADPATNEDVYAYHMKTGQLQLVSCNANGVEQSGNNKNASISGDGRFVVFDSDSASLVAGDTNGYRDVFVKDLVTGEIALVSRAVNGILGNKASDHAQISLGGEWIVFRSLATNLAVPTGAGVAGDDIFRVANPLLHDTLEGGAGNDTYVLYRNDVVTEQPMAGTDTIKAYISYTLGANLENLILAGTGNISGTGNALNNVITSNAGSNSINGGAGVDTASYATSTAAVNVDLNITAAQTTGAGNDVLIAIENLTGSNYADTLKGNANGNILNGGAGADTMIGGDGPDTYYVDNAADTVTESNANVNIGGYDTVYSYLTHTIASSAYILGANIENGRILATAASNLTGNGLNNLLYAGQGNNVINGGSGTDTVSYLYGTGSSTSGVNIDLSKTGAQTAGSSGSDTLNGLENLIGTNYADTLTGNSGNNVLTGGLGKDILKGNGGIDHFDFNALAETGKTSVTCDIISDFSTDDFIDLSTLDANTTNTAGSNDAFSAILLSATVAYTAPGQLKFDATRHILYGNTDSNFTTHEFAIQLTGVNALSAADIVL